MSRCRICARCGGLGVYSLGAPLDKVVRAKCENCEWLARLRPIASDWDGSWSLDGEDEEVEDPASDTRERPVERDNSASAPSVAGSYSPDEDEDSGPWCPRCEGDVEDDEVGGERAYWCPRCKSLYPSDEVLTPDSPNAARNHGGDSLAADGGPDEDEGEDVDVVDPHEEDPEGGLWRWSE